jgi:hypothetical protein
MGLDPGGHIYKFSLKTFSTICRAMGWEILLARNIGSPFRELYSKLKSWPSLRWRVYRFFLPALWFAAYLTRQGNRCFIILTKL